MFNNGYMQMSKIVLMFEMHFNSYVHWFSTRLLQIWGIWLQENNFDY